MRQTEGQRVGHAHESRAAECLAVCTLGLGTRRACHRRMSREQRQGPNRRNVGRRPKPGAGGTSEERQQPQAQAPSAPLGKGLGQIGKKFRYTKVTHQEMVEEDKVT